MSAPSSNINYMDPGHQVTSGGSAARMSNDHGMRPKHHQLLRELYSVYLVPGITYQEALIFVHTNRTSLTTADADDNNRIANVIMSRVGQGPTNSQVALPAIQSIMLRTLP